MTHKETINRNIGLTFDFLRQVVKNPDMLNDIPDGSTLEFVEKDFSKIEKTNSSVATKKRKFLKVKSELEVINK